MLDVGGVDTVSRVRLCFVVVESSDSATHTRAI